MAEIEREAIQDPELPTMNSYNNPLELTHTTFLEMKNESGLHGYAQKEVKSCIVLLYNFLLLNLKNYTYHGSTTQHGRI